MTVGKAFCGLLEGVPAGSKVGYEENEELLPERKLELAGDDESCCQKHGGNGYPYYGFLNSAFFLVVFVIMLVCHIVILYFRILCPWKSRLWGSRR